MSLTTVDYVKGLAGPTLNATDTQLESLIAGTSAHIEQVLHRTIWKKTYTEYLTGDNSSVLQLSNWPVISVSRVNFDDDGNFGQTAGSFDPSKDLVAGSDYCILAGERGIGSTGQLKRINFVWQNNHVWSPGKVAMQPSPPRGNILVIYTAGFAPVPMDIQYAAAMAIIRAVAGIPTGGAFQSASYEDGSVSMINPNDLTSLIGSVERIIAGRKVPVV